MALLKFKQGLANNLPDYVNQGDNSTVGTIYITSDTQEMKVDLPESRINISDFIIADSINETSEALIVDGNELENYYDNLFYYVKEEGFLRKYNGQEVIDGNTIFKWTHIGDTTALTGLSNRLDAAEKDIEELQNADSTIQTSIENATTFKDLTNDIIPTVTVGNYKKGEKIELKDLTDLKNFVINMISQDVNPTPTLPSITVAITNGGAKEAGTKLSPTYKITIKDGYYDVGRVDAENKPVYQYAGAEWSNYKATYGDIIKDGATGTFDEIVVTDRDSSNNKLSFSYKINGSADYTTNAIPKTFIGTEKPDLKITDGTATATSSAITAYRNCFYGTFTDKEELTSDKLRTKKSNGEFVLSTLKNVSNSTTFNLNIPVGTLRAVVAYPEESTGLGNREMLNSVKDANASDAQINTAFKYAGTILVDGNNGYHPIPYKVFYKDWSEQVTAANIYKVQL